MITISIGSDSIRQNERRIIEWAVAQALDRWNGVLSGAHQLLRIDGYVRPNILIEAVPLPLPGWAAGECSHPGTIGYSRARADTVIRIQTIASPGPVILPISPEAICNSIEHEIGHALGLSDTKDTQLLMCSSPWNMDFPAPSVGRSCIDSAVSRPVGEV